MRQGSTDACVRLVALCAGVTFFVGEIPRWRRPRGVSRRDGVSGVKGGGGGVIESRGKDLEAIVVVFTVASSLLSDLLLISSRGGR